MVIIQGLMTKDDFRIFLSWSERMEGQSIEFPVNSALEDVENDETQVSSPHARITLSIKDFSTLPKSAVKVNNKIVAYFSSPEVKLDLMAGDVVEIDSTYYNFPICYIVKKVSNNVSYPEKDETYTANKGIVMIGKIIVK